AAGEAFVGVDPPVTHGRPMAARFLQLAEIARGQQHFSGVRGGPAQDRAERVADERATPKLKAATGGALVPDPVDSRHVYAVGKRVRALDHLPGLLLRLAELLFFARGPADGGR